MLFRNNLQALQQNLFDDLGRLRDNFKLVLNTYTYRIYIYTLCQKLFIYETWCISLGQVLRNKLVHVK